MKATLDNFKKDITNLYKSYRLNHFSLIHFSQTFFEIKDNHDQINSFKIEDKDLIETIEFSEENIKNETSELGKYQKINAASTLVQFYQIWEDGYRNSIASKITKNKNDIKSDLFGDLNIIRQSIIHNNSKSFTNFKKIKLLTFMVSRDKLNLSSKEVSKTYKLILQEINSFESIYCK